MRLYVFPVAPNPTKVRLYLAEKAAGGATIDIAQVKVDFTQREQRGAAHLARKPFGTLPVLELDDGSCLVESPAIIEYQEEIHPHPAMIGRTALERARVRDLERIADVRVLLPLAQIVHATKSPLGYAPNPAVAARFQPALDDGLRVLDQRLSDGRAFVAGDTPSIADCTLAVALQFGRFGGMEIDPGFSSLTQWDARYRARETAKSVLSL